MFVIFWILRHHTSSDASKIFLVRFNLFCVQWWRIFLAFFTTQAKFFLLFFFVNFWTFLSSLWCWNHFFCGIKKQQVWWVFSQIFESFQGFSKNCFLYLFFSIKTFKFKLIYGNPTSNQLLPLTFLHFFTSSALFLN